MTYNFKGSEKQIKWAEDIAAEAFGELDALDHNIDNLPGVELSHEAVEEVRKSLGSMHLRSLRCRMHTM